MDKLQSLLEGRLLPGVYLLPTVMDRHVLASEFRLAGYNFYYIDGEHVSSEMDFYDEVQRALNLPDYFGRNWNALTDCLVDLSWLPSAKANVILFDAFEKFAKSNPEQFKHAYYVLRYATRANTAPLPCFVLFRGEESLLPEQLPRLEG